MMQMNKTKTRLKNKKKEERRKKKEERRNIIKEEEAMRVDGRTQLHQIRQQGSS